jgi:hypothetical protein
MQKYFWRLAIIGVDIILAETVHVQRATAGITSPTQVFDCSLFPLVPMDKVPEV